MGRPKKTKTDTLGNERRLRGRPATRREPFIAAFQSIIDDPAWDSTDPGEIATLAARVQLIGMREYLRGNGHEEIAIHVRAFANTIQKLIPTERIMAAERKINASRAPRKPVSSTGPDMEQGAEGTPSPSGRRTIRR